jgi:hypothetical protein
MDHEIEDNLQRKDKEMRKIISVLLLVLCIVIFSSCDQEPPDLPDGYVENSVWYYTLTVEGGASGTVPYGFRNGIVYGVSPVDSMAYPSYCFYNSLGFYNEGFAWFSQSMNGSGSVIMTFFPLNMAVNLMHYWVLPLFFVLEIDRQELTFDDHELTVYDCAPGTLQVGILNFQSLAEVE